MTQKDRALELFEQLVERGTDLDAGVVALTVRHPELKAELAEVHARFREIRDNFRFSTRSVLSLLRDPDGADPAIDVELPGDGHEGDILGRLRDRRGPQDRYVLVDEVGHGGMGTVLRVWDGDLRRHLAMKVVRRPDRTAAYSSRVLRFLEEAQVTGQLEHPCIVPVHELGVDGKGNAFFTMRLIRGRELGEVIGLVHEGAEGWSLTRGIGVLQRVAEAMAFAHSKGVVHRDLKPSNIMVGRFGEVYVMDWGLAKVLARVDGSNETPPIAEGSVTHVLTERGAADHAADAQLVTADGTVIGTPAFMSPEQAAGQIKDIGPRSDVYSMGAILYQLLCGSPPYVKPGQRIPPELLAAMVLHGPPTDLHEMAPRAPAELQAICQKAMARTPDGRYPSMLAMAEDLRAWLEGRVVAAYEAGAWAELKKWMRRNRAMATAGLLVLAIVVLGLGVIAWISDKKNRQIAAALELSVQSRIVGLQQRAMDLWPEEPKTVPAIDAWLGEVEGLAAELTPDRRREAGELLDRDGLLQAVRGRRERALAHAERSVTSPSARARWQQARASIADVATCPLYDGYELTPQTGLLPLRRDPRSQLWEFCHLLSGDEVEVSTTGQLVLTDGMGIVLVLIPRGPGRVPFFMSKYEMTQGQWRRFTGVDRSHHNRHGLLLPVDNVSWQDCDRVLAQLGLCLPSELQWLHAARAGDSALAWLGPLWGPQERRFAFLSDEIQETPRNREEQASTARLLNLADPEVGAHPLRVGSLLPNPFGLHDTFGNLWEWCAPPFDSPLVDPRKVPQRGGSYDTKPHDARRSSGYEDFKDSRAKFVGVRPARAVER